MSACVVGVCLHTPYDSNEVLTNPNTSTNLGHPAKLSYSVNRVMQEGFNQDPQLKAVVKVLTLLTLLKMLTLLTLLILLILLTLLTLLTLPHY
jgi:hypothetical protein